MWKSCVNCTGIREKYESINLTCTVTRNTLTSHAKVERAVDLRLPQGLLSVVRGIFPKAAHAVGILHLQNPARRHSPVDRRRRRYSRGNKDYLHTRANLTGTVCCVPPKKPSRARF